MAERNKVGDYITKKVLEVVETSMEREIEAERKNITDFISETIGKDIVQQMGIASRKKGRIVCSGNSDGVISALLFYTVEKYESERPRYVYSAIVRLKQLLEEEKEKKISLTDVEISDDRKVIKFTIVYDFSDL